VAPPPLAAWRPGLLGAPPAACRASKGLGLGARVRGSACDSIRCGEVKWCGCGVSWWTRDGGQWAGAWWAGAQSLRAQRDSDSALSSGFSVLRFGME